MDDFEIPSYEEYDKLLIVNFNVSQLKVCVDFINKK